MRIVNKQEFYKLPSGTICATYSPCIFGEPFVKLETLYSMERYGGDGSPIDFYYEPLWSAVESKDSGEEVDILEKAEKTGESFDMDYECTMRDGMFNQRQMYAVWEARDIEEVMKTLAESLSTAVKNETK